jgi:hypothetical protein
MKNYAEMHSCQENLKKSESKMKLIKPFEISARILSMLDESGERAVIVSPYMKISRWFKFANKINDLKIRRIPIEIYVRDDPDNISTYRDLDQLELTYKKIPHLHSKLYLNERYGIVTSMNLLLSSEINSLEIGYATETRKEYNDLLDYYYRYIHMGEPLHFNSIAGQPAADLKEIIFSLSKELNRTTKSSWLWFAGAALHIHAGGNNYRVSINEGYLNISTSLRVASPSGPKLMQHSSLIPKKMENLTAMRIEIHPVSRSGPQAGDIQLSGQTKYTLKSTCISGILKAEAAYVIESVTGFVEVTENLDFKPG